jgi:glycosyltransferase involved in cell wall biosynthesis
MKICIASPNKDIIASGSFINNHINMLQASVTLFGDVRPYKDGCGKSIFRFPMSIAPVRFFVKISSETFYHYLYTKALSRYLLNQKVDVLMAEYGHTAACMADGTLCAGVSLVAHFHGFDAFHKKTINKNIKAYLKLFDSAKAIVVVSEQMKHQLIKLGAPAEKLHKNACGVNTTEFDGAHPDKAGKLFVAVGQFVAKKNPLITIRAFHRIRLKHRDARLVMIGDGELFNEARRLVAELGIQNAVELKGELPTSEIAENLIEARCFVQHSMTSPEGDTEGLPVTILEAAAMGLPIVSTLHAGIPEAVIHNETGFLVPEGDENLMSEYMLQLAENPNLAQEMGRKGQAHVRNNFTLESRIERLHEILTKASCC